MSQKAYVWLGVVDVKCKIDVVPSKADTLQNLSIQSTRAYRTDFDGNVWHIHCDNEFDVLIRKSGKLIAIVSGKETVKFWYSSLEDAVNSAKDRFFDLFPVFYVHQYTDNYFTVDPCKMSIDCKLVKTLYKSVVKE